MFRRASLQVAVKIGLKSPIAQFSSSSIAKQLFTKKQLASTSLIGSSLTVGASATYLAMRDNNASKKPTMNDHILSLQRVMEDEAKTTTAREPTADLNMVGGYADILEQVADLVRYLQDPQQFTTNGVKPPKGVILHGEPGVGKTFLAEAIAGHAGVPIIVIGAAELMNPYVGGSEEKLRKLFASAKATAPCVLCLDEIDSVATARLGNVTHSVDHHHNTVVNQLLTLLAESNPGVVVIGTTNNFNMLDPAVIRPGRFDKHIYVPLPNQEERLRILTIHTKDKQLDQAVNLQHLSGLSGGFSGAKLAAWVNEAAIIAGRKKASSIDLFHFDEARDIIQFGTRGKMRLDAEQKRKVAIHEIGHALVGHLLGQKLYKVSVRTTQGRDGYTEFLPNEENRNKTKTDLEDIICYKLASRAAEQIAGFSQVGFLEDLKHSQEIAKRIIQEGMGVSLSGITQGMEVENILQEQMDRAKKMLKENEACFNRLVDGLIKNDVLYQNEFLDIINQKTPSFLSALFAGSKIKQNDLSESAIPPKKAFTRTIGQSNLFSASAHANVEVDKSIPFTIEEVAKKLNIKASVIRSIKPGLFDSIEIDFKPSFRDPDKKIDKLLYRHDVEHIYLEDHLGGASTLKIYKAGINDFTQFVKENNKPSYSPDNSAGIW
jgi:cell division protease FtsH